MMVDNFNYTIRPIIDNLFINKITLFGEYNIINGPWIAGGAIRKLWQGNNWHTGDIDIFFANKQQYNNFIFNLSKKFHQERYDEKGEPLKDPILYGKINYGVRKNYPSIVSLHKSDNAETFTISNIGLPGNRDLKVQVINRQFYNTPDDIFNDFDWTICQFVSDGKYMWSTTEAIKDLANKEIVLSSNTSREIKIPRLLKYMSYGFNPNDKLTMHALRYIESGKGKEAADDY